MFPLLPAINLPERIRLLEVKAQAELAAYRRALSLRHRLLAQRHFAQYQLFTQEAGRLRTLQQRTRPAILWPSPKSPWMSRASTPPPVFRATVPRPRMVTPAPLFQSASFSRQPGDDAVEVSPDMDPSTAADVMEGGAAPWYTSPLNLLLLGVAGFGVYKVATRKGGGKKTAGASAAA